MLFDRIFGLRGADKFTLRPKTSNDGASRGGASPRLLPAGSRTIGERYRFMDLRASLSKDSTVVLSLTAIWVLIELFIRPAGDFPLSDDWSYTRSLQQWYETGHYHLIGWTSMPLAAHLAWGMLFCKVFGFSFTVLRYSTLVLGLAGSIGAYFLAREFSDNKRACAFTALLLMLNPIYLNLSNTFMTDVPFTSCLILSLLFFVKGLRQNRLAYIAQGMLFVILATFVRQLGLLVAGAFSLALLVKEGISKRSLLIAGVATGLPLVLYLFYNHWLRVSGNYPIKYDEGFHRIRNTLFGQDHSTFKTLLRQALNIFVYSGIFIFPFIFRADWAAIWRQRKSGPFLVCVAVMAGAGIYCLAHHINGPLMGNILNPYGLGAPELRDVGILRLNHIPPLPPLFWELICVAGIIGGGVLLWSVMNAIRIVPESERPALLFLVIFAAIYCGIMLVGGTYDRYFIPLIPVLSVFLLTGHSGGDHTSPAMGRYTALLFLLAGAWFSVAGTFNYLGWNRGRWNALRYLTYEAGVSPAQIDGGFEFNGYYGYNDSDVSQLKEKADPARKSWWWVKDDAYLISFGPVKGYTVLKNIPCHNGVFPFAPENIFVLRRDP